ncbi:signal peptidase II [Candidatus Pelagibacter sp. HIMB1321]|uniref:signal peptidase II n=1 Tax=Candidatus Pelagibacter sp. HIMB1321 TaxID=1388755 RepID=UPI000A081D81|nr:signal peptidase II [Candidatus Pelagibacter sp. HIMB1321]SMF70562.1 signal peptidase II . Aspartic peptidase. MEROPS family A08 [Candidatus Pelagibacter sp. HIMB1321]
MLRFLNQKTIINLGVLLLIFAIDRFSKIYIVQKNLNGLSSEIKLNNFLSLDLVWNKGVAFGLFSMNSVAFYNVLTILILIIILIILYLSFTSSGFKKIAYLMIAGGAIGNVYDRIFYRQVPDFIDFHVRDFHWFIFNIADIFITFGVIFMILIECKTNKNE